MNSAENSSPFIGVEGVTRIYRTSQQQVPALRGVNLELPRAVLAALKGRSGSGKTTLLNIIGGLDQPSGGTVYFDGKSFAGLNDRELTMLRRKNIGFIFQSFALLPTFSAFENVELVLRLTKLSRNERAERASNCLRIVGLEKWAHHRPDEMSGGQQQRVAIARALATQPSLILADEPTGELDTGSSRQIFSLFKSIVRNEGITVLLSSHDPLVDEYADMIYVLQDGCIKEIFDKRG